QRFVDRGVDEAASVDDDEVGTFVGWRNGIAFRTKLRQDLLRIDKCFRASQRDKAHARIALHYFLSSSELCETPKLGKVKVEKRPRVWSCIRCCISMKSFALCSR